MDNDIYPPKEAAKLVARVFQAGSKEIHRTLSTPKGRAALLSFVYTEQCLFRDRLDQCAGVPFQLAADWEFDEEEHGHSNPEVIEAIGDLLDRLTWYDRAIGLALADTGLIEEVPSAANCPYGTLVMGCVSDLRLKSLRDFARAAFEIYRTGRSRRESPSRVFICRDRVAEVRRMKGPALAKRIREGGEDWPKSHLQPVMIRDKNGHATVRHKAGWFDDEIAHLDSVTPHMEALRESPGHQGMATPDDS